MLRCKQGWKQMSTYSIAKIFLFQYCFTNLVNLLDFLDGLKNIKLPCWCRSMQVDITGLSEAEDLHGIGDLSLMQTATMTQKTKSLFALRCPPTLQMQQTRISSTRGWQWNYRLQGVLWWGLWMCPTQVFSTWGGGISKLTAKLRMWPKLILTNWLVPTRWYE